MAPHLAAKIAEFVGFSDTPLTIEALLIEQKSSDQITESQSIHPSTKGGVEKANLLNISELLSAQQSSEGYSTGFSSYPTLRFKPWEILTFHERIPSIEYNASFRLKLDLFAHVMDWLHLKSKFGIERDAFMTMLKGVIGAVIRRAQLVGPIGVVVRTMRVEGIIQETKTRFSARVVAELATEGDEESSYTENSSPEMLKKEKKKRKNLLANEKEASCLLVWLWVLESVPVKFLSSGDYEVKIEEVRRVFRGEDDQASVSSGAVVLLRD
jgi:hypothetical protein